MRGKPFPQELFGQNTRAGRFVRSRSNLSDLPPKPLTNASPLIEIVAFAPIDCLSWRLGH